MEAALVAVRLAQFAAAFILVGTPVFALAFAARFPPHTDIGRDFARWQQRCQRRAAIAALATALLWLDLEAAIMGNGWDQAVDPATLALVLFDTAFGRAWRWHLAIGAVLLGVAWQRPARVAATAVIAALGTAFVAGLAWAGHAVMHPGVSHLANQVVHLLAGALWLGSLPALLLILVRARREPAAAWTEAVHTMLPLYSRAGYGAVALVLLTGILNSTFLVGSVAALATTLYGRVLVAKIALVLVMVGIAAVNRFWLLPRGPAPLPERERRIALRLLCRSVAIELGTGVLVLAAVSVLGTLPPALAP
jgi:copper resistance protein D